MWTDCNVVILYVKRKEGGRGVMSVERCVREERNSLGFYVANSEEILIRGVAAADTVSTENTVMSGEFKKQKAQALLFAAQEQDIRTNYVKHHIDKTSESPLCRLCGKKCESVQHLVSGCEILAQREVLWVINVQCDNVIKTRRTDLILIDKKERKGIIIDIAVPAD